MQNEKSVLTLVPRAVAEHPVSPGCSYDIGDTQTYFSEYAKILGQLPYSTIERIINLLYEAYTKDQRVFLFGNGGSAALASHFACDLGKGTAHADSRKRFRVLSLTDNVPMLTAWANDTSYERVFAEQLQNFVEPGDVAFGISGSGCSANVLLGLEAARDAGGITAGLTGFQGGKMVERCDVCAIIPSDNMQIIEDLQLGITHAIFTVIRHRIVHRAESRRASTATLAA